MYLLSYGTDLRAWSSTKTIIESSKTWYQNLPKRRRGWVTGETIALAGQADLVRIQRTQNHWGLKRQTIRALRRDRSSILAQLVQKRLRWFGHTTSRPDDELIKDLLLPTPTFIWHRRTGATTIKADLEPLSGQRTFDYARSG